MRKEFSTKIKAQAYERSGGRCEVAWCCAPLRPGRYHFDHIIPDGLGGEATLINCQVICAPCHADKTAKRDIPAIAKTKRIARRHIGIRKPRKITRWRKFNGEIVNASRERQ